VDDEVHSDDGGLDGSRVPLGSGLTGLRSEATESMAVRVEGLGIVGSPILHSRFRSSMTNKSSQELSNPRSKCNGTAG
jgi:hypothetical protein